MAAILWHPLQLARPCTRPLVRPHVRTHICLASASCEQVDDQGDDEPIAALPLEKLEWQRERRILQGRKKHRLWEPQLRDPPPLLHDVCIVLVSPKRPISVGTVARSCACFECEDLRIVQPRCDHLARSSRNGSKGAQFLLQRAQEHGSLQSALADAEFSIACTRWVAGRRNAYRSTVELLAAPQIAVLLALSHLEAATAAGAQDSRPNADTSNRNGGGNGSSAEVLGQQQQRREGKKLALVFGREVSGLTAAELDMCDATLSIPIGRLQESMSLSHAVSVVLSRLFEERSVTGDYSLPQGMADLAPGFQDSGVER